MTFSNQYAQLGNQFSRQSLPEKPKKPELLLWNEPLAHSLGLDINDAKKTAIFSGQQLADGSKPIAMAYSGHQFGHFNPQLGDGRAHLLGELKDQQGKIQEIQLKGSGQTPFSRNGDGKCGIKPAVREYLMSEALYALGVPTTRCLAVVTTGCEIIRQHTTAGAVVTRVADSHIRVGTFEYFAARKMHNEIKTLAVLTIERHFPEINRAHENGTNKYLRLLSQVIDNQIKLIIEWMRIGFIHGVMNTDNTLLSGQTIDYGPCAMMGTYDPATVFSSIDQHGRYAFGNQANIAQWNMARLAECLLSLIAEEEQQAIDAVMPLLHKIPGKYTAGFNTMMAKKLGFKATSPAINELQQELLNLMFKYKLDYTETFVALKNSLEIKENTLKDKIPPLASWHQQWLKLLNKQAIDTQAAITLMAQNNPVVIPRNHHVEQVLDKVEQDFKTVSVAEFLRVLRNPYTQIEETHKYQDPAADLDLNYQTFCGT